VPAGARKFSLLQTGSGSTSGNGSGSDTHGGILCRKETRRGTHQEDGLRGRPRRSWMDKVETMGKT